jgi:hypothetical protein
MTKPAGEKGAQVRHVFIDGERFSFEVSTKTDKEEEAGDSGDNAEETADAAPGGDESEEKKEESEGRQGTCGPLSVGRRTAFRPRQTHRDRRQFALKNATVITVVNGTLPERGRAHPQRAHRGNRP